MPSTDTSAADSVWLKFAYLGLAETEECQMVAAMYGCEREHDGDLAKTGVGPSTVPYGYRLRGNMTLVF